MAVGVFAGATFLIQVGSVLVVLFARGGRESQVIGTPAVSILRPVRGIENNIEETLRSGFLIGYPHYELIFCVADGSDAVVPIVERLMAENPRVAARLLVGDERVSVNPKLNNLVKGWAAAEHDWVVMADSNVLMPRNYVQALFEAWTPGTGLVCSPPVGIRPVGFWAEVECAFLNTFQARWQLAADAGGQGFAQGKTMLWRREDLDRAGGLAVLGREVAEDAASTKFVRRRGRHVRLVAEPFPQPLGRRAWAEIWRRQLRWGRLRRASFPLFFAPELFSGGFFPLLAMAGLAVAGALPAGAAAAYALVWYGAEAALAHRFGWPMSPRSVVAWLTRDALLPALWFGAVAGSDFVWRGNPMEVEKPAETAVRHVLERSRLVRNGDQS
jgi:ceramide glucosyltransferase